MHLYDLISEAKGAELTYRQITTPDGQRVALGIPSAQKKSGDDQPHKDIPLGRPGSATEAASSILMLCSPLASYVNGQ